jgi:hypothetical protein
MNTRRTAPGFVGECQPSLPRDPPQPGHEGRSLALPQVAVEDEHTGPARETPEHPPEIVAQPVVGD